MSYVPAVPGVPPPMSYGQGFSNWQQYAGYNKDNPFGGNPGFEPSQLAAVPPKDNAQPAPAIPAVPEPVEPDYSLTPAYGVKQKNTFGTNPANQYGVHSNLYDAVVADDK